MKQILLNISLLSISLLVSAGAVIAQTTILEQDGASNQFVGTEWVNMSSGSFPTTSKVAFLQSGAGTLNINNTSTSYKNIKVEVRFDHPTNNASFSFDLAVKETGDELKKTGVIGDATGVMPYAYQIVEYNNPTGFKINQMVFSNPSKNLNITYIKITGTATNAGIDSEELNAFEVKVSPENITIDSKIDGTLSVYNSLGQVEGTYIITKGENILSNATQGLLFLALTDTNNKMVTRKKIMR